MFKNYFKIAYRNLARNKAYALINISGLAIGIAACLLIFLVVRYELSYNTFQRNYASVYHIFTQDQTQDGISYNPGIPYPALDALRTDFPQTTISGLYATFGTQVTVPKTGSSMGTKFIESSGVFFSDPQFFSVFSFNWLIGKAAMLAEPNVVALSKSIAIKYFGDWKNAVGKLIRVDNAMDLKVCGVFEDLPDNSDLPVTVMGSLITIKNNRYYGYTTDWGSTTSNFQVFMLLPGNSADRVRAQLPALSNKYYGKNGAGTRTNVLQPLSAIHFDTQVPGFGDHTTSYRTLLTLVMIALFIIVMACINFINLSTAQAVGRSKEVGMRKVLGSGRLQLFLQIMSETLLIVLVAAALAIVLTELALPYLKYVTSISGKLPLFTVPNLLFLGGVVLATAFLSGLYPAMVLSGFTPAMALKNKISSASVGGISLRRGLVVTQFAISQLLIVGTLVAISQMDFIRTADLGFNRETILVLSGSTDSAMVARYAPFKQRLLQMPDVKMAALCSDVPSSDNNSGINFAYDHKPGEQFTLYTKFGDADYFKTFDLKFVAGKPYTLDDTAGQFVVNETLLKKLNVKDPQQAIGKQIRTGANRWRTITGVVKDFKTNSLREEVKPLLIASRKRQFGLVSIKLHSRNLVTSQAEIQKLWDQFFPEYAYSSFFMDEQIARFYQQEEQMALLFKIFAALAVFISCLGLYGLVSFMAVQRTKEVGIRKVLGAGVSNIVLLFSQEFTWLIVLAFVVSAPLAWYFMNGWLNNFVYRVSIGWPVFVIAIAASLAVAWLAVGYKAFRAAIANPIKSLRTE